MERIFSDIKDEDVMWARTMRLIHLAHEIPEDSCLEDSMHMFRSDAWPLLQARTSVLFSTRLDRVRFFETLVA